MIEAPTTLDIMYDLSKVPKNQEDPEKAEAYWKEHYGEKVE